jgi:hypothetical protein
MEWLSNSVGTFVKKHPYKPTTAPYKKENSP